MMSMASIRARLFSRRVGIASVYLGATVLARAGAVLLIPLYTRRLSLAEYGDYALAQTLISLLATPIALGLHAAVGRFYFDLNDLSASKERVGSAARWLVVVTIGIAALLELLVLAARPAGTHGIFGRWELSCIVWGAAGASVGQVPPQYLKSAQRPFPAAAFQLTEFFLTVGSGLFMVLYLGRGFRGAVEAMAIAGLANGVIATGFVLIALKGPLSRVVLREAMRFSLPFIPHGVGNQVQFVADRWVMKLTGNETALGAYALASQLTTPVSMAIEAWHQASGPQIGEALRTGGIAEVSKRRFGYQRSYLLVGLATSLAVCVALPIAGLLVGKSFHAALWIAPLLCALIVMESLYLSNAVMLLYANEPAWLPKITIPAGALNVLLNAALVPFFGIGGALTSRAVAMGLRSGAMWAIAGRRLRERLERSGA